MGGDWMARGQVLSASPRKPSSFILQACGKNHLPIPSRQGSRDWSKSIRPPDSGPSRHVRGLGVLHPSTRSTSPKAVFVTRDLSQ